MLPDLNRSQAEIIEPDLQRLAVTTETGSWRGALVGGVAAPLVNEFRMLLKPPGYKGLEPGAIPKGWLRSR